MDVNEEGIKEEDEIYGKIAEVVHLICNNPAIYFSEADIHVLMMKSLMDINRFNPFDKKHGLSHTGCTTGVNKDGGIADKGYKTMLVHREYGNNKGIGERSDIVIFDKNDVVSISHPRDLKSEDKYLEPKYIFEFGTEKVSGRKKEKYKRHVEQDLEKLSKCKKEGRGFLVHIHRNYVMRRNPKTIKKYQNEIKKAWELWKAKDRVKMLVFFVEIGVPTRRITSKIKMFNPYPSVNSGNWEEVSLNKIEKIIKKFLKDETPDLVGIIDSVNHK
jgi:hypothetical protein